MVLEKRNIYIELVSLSAGKGYKKRLDLFSLLVYKAANLLLSMNEIREKTNERILCLYKKKRKKKNRLENYEWRYGKNFLMMSKRTQ